MSEQPGPIEQMVNETEFRGLVVELDQRVPDGLDKHYIAFKDPRTGEQLAAFGNVPSAMAWLHRQPRR